MGKLSHGSYGNLPLAFDALATIDVSLLTLTAPTELWLCALIKLEISLQLQNNLSMKLLINTKKNTADTLDLEQRG